LTSGLLRSGHQVKSSDPNSKHVCGRATAKIINQTVKNS